MTLDGIILNKIIENFKMKLPMRINRITGISQNELIINVYAAKERVNLFISCHSLYNRIHFTKKEYQGIDEPSGFIMLLRKHINGGIIEDIIQNNYDRYLIFKIRALNDMYDEKLYSLCVELMGKYANIILVNEDNKILDALKRIPPFENNKRTIWPGSIFEVPNNQNKKNPFANYDIDKNISLLSQYQGFSPLLVKEIEYRLNHDSFENIMKTINNSNKLYITNIDNSIDFHIIPLLHINNSFNEFEINYGFDYIYYQLEEKERIKQITGDLFKYTKRQINHYKTKLIKLESSLIEANNCEHLKDYGELLYTYSNLSSKGLNSIRINDYEGNEVDIILNPKYNIKDNANRYFTSYQKKRKSQKYLDEQIIITKNELEYFNSIEEQLSIANYNDALLIKDEMVKFGYLKDHSKNKKRKKKNMLGLYQIEYKNHKITFGKNNIQNDILTFNYAKNNYTWFHAQNYHGSHLCIDTDNPDEDMIRFCANLAAYFSKGRFSSSVGVDYCLIKDVKKIKGSKVGKVSIRNYKTIFIDPILDKNILFTSI